MADENNTPKSNNTGGDVEFEAQGAGGQTDEVAFEADPAVQKRIDDFDAAKSGGGGAEGEKKTTAQTIRDEASKLGGQAGERLKAFAGDGKGKATDALDELARMLEKAAGDVDDKLGSQFGGYARSAAGSVQNLAEQVRGREIDDVLEDVGAFVKKSPAIAIGTAAAFGFVLARLVAAGVDANRNA